MAQVKKLRDEYGIIHQACKILPLELRSAFLDALAELEDNSCHISRSYPKTRLHRVKGYSKAIYRADIQKISGWRLHVQFDKSTDTLHLNDVVDGADHDDVIRVIKSKSDRYE